MTHLLIRGDARRLPIRDGSVHCVVTSPPYFGLRDYQTSSWVDGAPACDHHESKPSRVAAAVAASGLEGGKGNVHRSHEFKGDCLRCGARRVDRQLGLEPSPDAYVAAMVAAMREVRRVLRDDGTAWLNLAPSYASSSMDSDLWKLRDDLTPEEIRYVLFELAIAQGGTSSDPD